MSVDPYDVKGIEKAIYNTFRKYESGEPLRINSVGIESFDRKTLASRLDHVLRQLA